MSGEAITVMSALVFCYALTARRLTFVNVTAPMLSILAGLIVFSTRPVEINSDFVHLIAEITLVIILFHDASTVRLSRLRHDPGDSCWASGGVVSFRRTACFASSHTECTGSGW